MHSVFELTVLPNLEFPMCITTRRKNGPVTSPWVTRATNQINVFIKLLLSLPSTLKTPRQVPFCKQAGVNATWKAFLVPLSLIQFDYVSSFTRQGDAKMPANENFHLPCVVTSRQSRFYISKPGHSLKLPITISYKRTMNWFVHDPFIIKLKFMSLFYANGLSDSFGNGVYYPRKDIQFAVRQFSRKLISLKVRDLLLWTPPTIMVY